VLLLMRCGGRRLSHTSRQSLLLTWTQRHAWLLLRLLSLPSLLPPLLQKAPQLRLCLLPLLCRLLLRLLLLLQEPQHLQAPVV
jgi:hypothetical protein